MYVKRVLVVLTLAERLIWLAACSICPIGNFGDIIYFIISSLGMIPQRLAAEGSLAQTLGLCGTSWCHDRGSK
jgi:hypothetical protein